MDLIKFYFDPKVGLRNPSKTFDLLGTITCWFFNVLGCIGAVVSLIGSMIGLSFSIPYLGFLVGVIAGCINAVIVLALFKGLGWLCSFGFQCRAIKLAAYEKILSTNFAPVSPANASPSTPAAATQSPSANEAAALADSDLFPTGPVIFDQADTPAASAIAPTPVPLADHWTCSVCGASITTHASTCRRCGTPRSSVRKTAEQTTPELKPIAWAQVKSIAPSESTPEPTPVAEADGWSCPSCGCRNSMSQVFCRTCNSVRPSTAKLPQTPAPSKSTKKNAHWRCRICGSSNNQDDSVCKICGRPKA